MGTNRRVHRHGQGLNTSNRREKSGVNVKLQTKMYQCPVCGERTPHYKLDEGIWECEQCGNVTGKKTEKEDDDKYRLEDDLK